MQLTTSTPKTASKPDSRARWSWFRNHFKVLAGFLVALVLSLGLFLAGAVAERRGFVDKAEKVLALDKVHVCANYVRSFGAHPEHLTIDIKHKYYETLARWRQLALKRGQITSDLKNYVPATIRYKDRLIRVKLRLRGEWIGHLSTDKWSFRINVKGDDSLFGMKRFSILSPRRRSYIYEWVYHRALAREDIVSLRYQFVTVTVNGRNLGVFALEEACAKQLIEHNRRREGVIVRFNADYRYQPLSHKPGKPKTGVDSGISSEHSSEIIAYGAKKFATNSGLRNQFLVAHNLLEAFRRGKLPTHEVFDVERLAMYYAISELTGAMKTADDWSDRKFLYNPVTSRLEPVGSEGATQPHRCTFSTGLLLGAKHTGAAAWPIDFHTLIFRDDVFFRHYVHALEKVSDPAYLDELIADITPGMHEQLKIIHRDYPYIDFSKELFAKNAEAIRDLLSPNKGLHAYFVAAEGKQCDVELGAIQTMPVEVLKLSSDGVDFVPSTRLLLPGKGRLQRVQYQRARFAIASGSSWTDAMRDRLKVHYRIWGSRKERVADVFGWMLFDKSRFESDFLRKAPNHQQFPFLSVDEANKTITFKPGRWQVNQNMILPAGYTVLAGDGVQLDLTGSAKILSYSPLHFLGSEERPVLIESNDGTGQGLVVLEAGETSILRHVVFRRLSTPAQGGWELTGAITFHRSPVEFSHCEFVDNDSEDGLNIIRSTFRIDTSFFENTSSDALDVDFATGRITRSTFSGIGGDAIDLSGSQIEIGDICILDVADKAVSVGEGSVLNGQNIDIARSRIGVAAKDLSYVTLRGVNVSHAEIGLTVFQKKPEYGPATMNVDGLAVQEVQADYVAEKNSTLTVEGRQILQGHTNVKKRIYGSESG